MTRGRGIYDDEKVDKKGEKDRAGPKDEGGQGGMATRENTPDADEIGEEPTD